MRVAAALGRLFERITESKQSRLAPRCIDERQASGFNSMRLFSRGPYDRSLRCVQARPATPQRRSRKQTAMPRRTRSLFQIRAEGVRSSIDLKKGRSRFAIIGSPKKKLAIADFFDKFVVQPGPDDGMICASR